MAPGTSLCLNSTPGAKNGTRSSPAISVAQDLLACSYESRLNRAAAIGWRGCVDTDLNFSEFFGSDHTVMGWFMLQYPVGYAGPIWAERGSGTYFVGQGNFRYGPIVGPSSGSR